MPVEFLVVLLVFVFSLVVFVVGLVVFVVGLVIFVVGLVDCLDVLVVGFVVSLVVAFLVVPVAPSAASNKP